MVPIRQMLVDPSMYYCKCPYPMTPTRIIVHNTYNDAPARNEISYMRSNGNYTSFHVAVDDAEIVQGIPFNRHSAQVMARMVQVIDKASPSKSVIAKVEDHVLTKPRKMLPNTLLHYSKSMGGGLIK